MSKKPILDGDALFRGDVALAYEVYRQIKDQTNSVSQKVKDENLVTMQALGITPEQFDALLEEGVTTLDELIAAL
ncbi:MAG TPA: hypothetical protein VMW29_02275 [Candidatus Bathyarchaeia archaeon]|nr:hypothetical protein [Candidatus Bathyarchaeia archaeon]